MVRVAQWRLILVAALAFLFFHMMAVLYVPSYGAKMSVQNAKQSIMNWAKGGNVWMNGHPIGSPSAAAAVAHAAYEKTDVVNDEPKANATFVILARNSDVWQISNSIQQIEDRFNWRFHYPYVFLNDEPFSDEFKEMTSKLASGICEYGLIDPKDWEEPTWIDTEKAAETREKMKEKKVIYGDSVSYRRMCRYQSGYFWRHPLMDKYDYYWRIEPSVKYFCNLDYDPFVFMRNNKKKYGFTISIYEYRETIESLWSTVKGFMKEYPQYIANHNLMDFISNDGGETYNLCHFWSNFEIGDLNFYRSDAYRTYFDYLDKTGNFFYERWGDAPVHSIAAALMLDRDEIHWFDDIGYRHEPFQHCPAVRDNKCNCNKNDSFENHWYSCTSNYKKLMHFG